MSRLLAPHNSGSKNNKDKSKTQLCDTNYQTKITDIFYRSNTIQNTRQNM